MLLPGIAALAGACGAAPESLRTAILTDVSAQPCIADETPAGPDPAASCPGFLIETVRESAQVCREAGGRLRALDPANVFGLDVNADGQLEYAFAIDDILSCEDAWSLFSCGSLGCPKALYGERDGVWRFIGSISAALPEAIEITDSAHGDGYRDLVVACGAGQECSERWHYLWSGANYEAVNVEVRGYRVEFAGSVHGLYALAADTRLLATPDAAGQQLEPYAAGTEVAIIGTAEAGDYFYVSPCNACPSGFVPIALIPSAR